MIATSGQNIAAPVELGRLFVPISPAFNYQKTDVGRERWRAWLWRVATFRDYRQFATIRERCRIEATVRHPIDENRIAPSDEDLVAWRRSVRYAAVRTGLVRGDCLVSVEVSFEPLVGVPLEDQPRLSGTDIVFIEEGGDE